MVWRGCIEPCTYKFVAHLGCAWHIREMLGAAQKTGYIVTPVPGHLHMANPNPKLLRCSPFFTVYHGLLTTPAGAIFAAIAYLACVFSYDF